MIAIEASHAAASVLRENLRLNRAGEQVRVMEAAAGDKDGELAMLDTGPIATDYFVAAPANRSDVRRVPMRSLDSIVREFAFVPTHVKIDVEGFEEEVLIGASELLTTHHPLLFLELHGPQIRERGKDPATVLDLLERYGYSDWRQSGQPINRGAIAAAGFECRLVCVA